MTAKLEYQMTNLLKSDPLFPDFHYLSVHHYRLSYWFKDRYFSVITYTRSDDNFIAPYTGKVWEVLTYYNVEKDEISRLNRYKASPRLHDPCLEKMLSDLREPIWEY